MPTPRDIPIFVDICGYLWILCGYLWIFVDIVDICRYCGYVWILWIFVDMCEYCGYLWVLWKLALFSDAGPPFTVLGGRYAGVTGYPHVRRYLRISCGYLWIFVDIVDIVDICRYCGYVWILWIFVDMCEYCGYLWVLWKLALFSDAGPPFTVLGGRYAGVTGYPHFRRYLRIFVDIMRIFADICGYCGYCGYSQILWICVDIEDICACV